MWLHHEIQISVNSDAKSRETNVRKLNSSHDWKLNKQIQFTPFCIRLNGWIPERTIRENAFEEKKKKPTLKFTPIALISIWTDRFFFKKKTCTRAILSLPSTKHTLTKISVLEKNLTQNLPEEQSNRAKTLGWHKQSESQVRLPFQVQRKGLIQQFGKETGRSGLSS